MKTIDKIVEFKYSDIIEELYEIIEDAERNEPDEFSYIYSLYELTLMRFLGLFIILDKLEVEYDSGKRNKLNTYIPYIWTFLNILIVGVSSLAMKRTLKCMGML